MRLADRLRLRLRSLFRKRRVEDELEDELRFHLEQQIEENISRGMAPEEARYAALRGIGGLSQVKEECRDARGLNLLESIAQDLRFAARVLRKSPGFTAAVAASLALGIGANTAIFSIINAALLRPLPFPDPDRLVAVWEDTPIFGLRYSPAAMGNYGDWKAQNHVFENMGALERMHLFTLTGMGEPEAVEGCIVTASLFRVLGVHPVLGRLFREEEDQPGTPKVALLSHSLWQRRFAGERDIAGRAIDLNGEKYTVAGVMPEGFRFPDAGSEIWAPIGVSFPKSEFTERGRHDLMVVARLRPGVTRERANEEMRAIASRLSQAYPKTNGNVSAFVAPLREHMVESAQGRLFAILFGAVSLVLLIACANVANLMLSRAVTRGKEVAVRIALGAGRARVARQLAAENLLLAAIGAAAGVLLAAWSMRLFKHLVPPAIAAFVPLSFDSRVLAYSLILTTATCFLFSLPPLAQAFRTEVSDALKQGGGRSGAARSSHTLRRALVISEVALALMLLIGAGLLIRTFARLRGVNPGFRADRVLTMRMRLTATKYRDQSKRVAFYRQVLERISAVPGVVSAGFTTGVPLLFKGFHVGVTLNGSDFSTVNFRSVTTDYLRTMGIPLKRGRMLSAADTAEAPAVALVNETMARRFWPDRDPLGMRFSLDSGRHWLTVAGVVGDVKQAGLDVPPRPEFYVPYEQERGWPADLAVRTAGDPLGLLPAIRREIRAVDRDQPITNTGTMEDILDREVFQRRLQMLILACFAGCALVLASIGVYGVLSYLVNWRTREIGVRMALGADSSDILASVIGQGVVLAASGIAIGLAAALALTRLMSHLLFGVTATDPATFIGVPALFLAIALLASYIPARRATRVDPVLVLRNE